MEEIIAYTIPAIVVGGIFYLYMIRFFDFEKQRNIFELRRNQSKEHVEKRLQAYERMLLFLDRNNPNHLILRNPSLGGLALIELTRQELNHNITQQLYLSNTLWSEINKYIELCAKEILILEQQASSNGTSIQEEQQKKAAQIDDLNRIIVNLLKKEIQELF